MKTEIEIIKESMTIDSNGDISFKSRTGRGSGAGVKIPAAQFDEFVKFINETQQNRQNK